MSIYKRLYINGKCVLRCRKVLEDKLGRELTKYEVPHHINGDKLDDRPENLEVMTRSEHWEEHIKRGDYVPIYKFRVDKQPKIAKEPGHSWCSGCQKFLPVIMFSKNKTRHSGYCQYCKTCKKRFSDEYRRGLQTQRASLG